MGGPAAHQLATSFRLGFGFMLSKLYVPITSLVLFASLGSWLAERSEFDPLTIAQKGRISFQTGKEDLARIDGLSPTGAALASHIVQRGFAPSHKPNEVLFLGNSQTMAIMDERPGDLTTPQWLEVFMSHQSSDPTSPAVILGSLPNLSMPEFLVRLVAGGEWQSSPVRTAIGCITLREWRGLAIRDDVLQIAATPAVSIALSRLIASSPDLPYADAAIAGAIKPVESSEHAHRVSEPDSLAVKLERTVENVANLMPLFKMRPYLYSRICVYYTSLRNCLLDIHSETPRPVLETTYRASLQLLELSVRYVQSRGIKLVFYLAPIRPIEPNPVLPADLARFRKDVFGVCEKYRVACFDYTYLVPERLWTNYPELDAVSGGERDYAHFTGPAHKLVAERIMTDSSSLLAGSAH
jgi:hypothetical protein